MCPDPKGVFRSSAVGTIGPREGGRGDTQSSSTRSYLWRTDIFNIEPPLVSGKPITGKNIFCLPRLNRNGYAPPSIDYNDYEREIA